MTKKSDPTTSALRTARKSSRFLFAFAAGVLLFSVLCSLPSFFAKRAVSSFLGPLPLNGRVAHVVSGVSGTEVSFSAEPDVSDGHFADTSRARIRFDYSIWSLLRGRVKQVCVRDMDLVVPVDSDGGFTRFLDMLRDFPAVFRARMPDLDAFFSSKPDVVLLSGRILLRGGESFRSIPYTVRLAASENSWNRIEYSLQAELPGGTISVSGQYLHGENPSLSYTFSATVSSDDFPGLARDRDLSVFLPMTAKFEASGRVLLSGWKFQSECFLAQGTTLFKGTEFQSVLTIGLSPGRESRAFEFVLSSTCRDADKIVPLDRLPCPWFDPIFSGTPTLGPVRLTSPQFSFYGTLPENGPFHVARLGVSAHALSCETRNAAFQSHAMQILFSGAESFKTTFSAKNSILTLLDGRGTPSIRFSGDQIFFCLEEEFGMSDLAFSGMTLEWPASKIVVRDLSLVDDTLSAKQITFDGRGTGSLQMKRGDQTSEFSGQLKFGGISIPARAKFTGEEPFFLLDTPNQHLAPQTIRLFYPDIEKLGSLRGSLAFRMKIPLERNDLADFISSFSPENIKYSASFLYGSFTSARFPGLSLNSISLTGLPLRSNMEPRTSGAEETVLKIANARYGNLQLRNIQATLNEENGVPVIQSATANAWGGTLILGRTPLRGELPASFPCRGEKISLASFLSQVGLGDLRGQGLVAGELPLHFSPDGTLGFRDALLYTVPGESGILHGEIDSAIAEQNRAGDTNAALLFDALSNFSYEWGKLRFSSGRDAMNLRMEFKGRPRQALKYEYDKTAQEYRPSDTARRIGALDVDLSLEVPFRKK